MKVLSKITTIAIVISFAAQGFAMSNDYLRLYSDPDGDGDYDDNLKITSFGSSATCSNSLDWLPEAEACKEYDLTFSLDDCDIVDDVDKMKLRVSNPDDLDWIEHYYWDFYTGWEEMSYSDDWYEDGRYRYYGSETNGVENYPYCTMDFRIACVLYKYKNDSKIWQRVYKTGWIGPLP